MARPERAEPTERELDILKILWEIGPAELGQVCAELRKREEVATTTVATLLGVMLKKGFVTRAQGARTYLWRPRIKREATCGQLLNRLLDKVFDGSAGLLVSSLLESRELSQDDRRQILSLLQEGESAGRPSKSRDKT